MTEEAQRIRIEHVVPVLDGGRFPVKRTVGDIVSVSADIFRDGHEILGAVLRVEGPSSTGWADVPMVPLGNDRFCASFPVTECGSWRFFVTAWRDTMATWREELRRKVEAGQEELSGELAEGAALLGLATVDVETGLASTKATREEETQSPIFTISVDRERARFGSWYELFPRSWGGFAGVEAALPDLAAARFDVVYFPPIHPIGVSGRKGANNAPSARPGEPGSPWAIGSKQGGHDAIDPGLGTLADFDRVVARAGQLGLEVALDLALQCSPDHPWLTEHPEWFERRPDGTIKFAENPPKRYQDIVNFNWDSPDKDALWAAIRDVVLHWLAHGVRIFRVDNPHTKPLPFWEWLIAEVRRQDEGVIFLAEAFTGPAMMRTLAKIGFQQSYTYFTWKNTRAELTEYVTELAGEMAEYYRPNFFANTPDILHEYLQVGGQPAFEARLVLAATLSPSYGIYSGYEAAENVAVARGSEEYLGSEKYELKHRSFAGPLVPLVHRLNEIRRSNLCLQRLDNITFLETANEGLIAFVKQSEADAVVVVVNLDPGHWLEGLVDVPVGLGLPGSFAVQDLLDGTTYSWTTGGNYVALAAGKAHVLHVR